MVESLSQIGAWVEEKLPYLIANYQVPAASVAILSDGDVVRTAAGILNKASGVEATTDSVFQIGSITKVWTTSLVMQLVDEGLVDLEAPVRRYVKDFVIADEAAAARITVRQLLSHLSGFEGDMFTATTEGEDAVEKFMPILADVPQHFEPGEMFSYNNAAFSVLGRIVELVRGKHYEACLREHLIDPLQLKHAATGAGEAIMFRAALGHISPTEDAAPEPAQVWSVLRSNSPSGSIFAMSASNLIAFAKMHIDGGVGPDGNQILSAESVKAMQEQQVKLPELGLMGDSWGLGWGLFNWEGGLVIGHDGGTIGQRAFLRVIPGQKAAIAVLTNGGDVIGLYKELISPVINRLTGIVVPELPTPANDVHAIDTSRFVGTYSSRVADSHVTQDAEGRIWLEHKTKGVIAEPIPQQPPVELVHWKGDTLIPRNALHGMHTPHAFVGNDGNGNALYLHTGRAYRRVSA
ncbi:CubicO group peptidase (beta-lactamase class C family) [Pseudarthrobacter sp. W1I19]|uniref:serine hydrolase domain-containing protein n=1 Tax=Pseudarthrobacter sp. W1I19 TaxID=3042288 RepID=UPI00278318E3|nr:serine hydrolase domain-containing protein [Pseudarthrobacter sp. W1I19]MDQ0923437.1 CubicO group peptidase (beta-lactamase class C family) [Pseudarthrobacter sp. W1I19]